MPRIPVRVEPYSSPSRQHRHYKNKRDQVLRALGKSAYINGSHFAIMWVSARGDVETYASEALQGRLDEWFIQGGIAEEAKGLVLGSQGQPRSNPFDGANGEDGMTDDEGGAADDADAQLHATDDVFTDAQSNLGAHQARLDQRPPFARSSSSSNAIGKAGKLMLDTTMANDAFARSRDNFGFFDDMAVPHSAPLPGLDAPGSASTAGPRSAIPRLPRTASSAQTPTFEVSLKNEAARTAFLELRFSQLQQGMCKTVAKAWIKIIEPKKQTRCPYNKGEEGKPTWWPEGVRHKEPDHLMKPERHLLLLTILRSPKIQVARLQLATAEVVSLIRADRVSLLSDVYKIAREEEKMREAAVDMDTPMTVGVSSIEGWSDADQAATSDAGRSASPADEDERIPGASASRASKKRPFAVAMGRSVSNSSVNNRQAKRRAAPGELQELPRPSSSGAGVGGPNSWQMQEAAAHNSIRKHQAAIASNAAAAAAAGYGGPGYDQVHGLITPVSGNSQLMDPNFAMAASASADGNRYAGYMSAPQPPHAQLYAHHSYTGFDGTNEHAVRQQQQQQQQVQQQQQQQVQQQQTSNANNLFAYNNPTSSRASPPHGSVLGLQGIDSSTNMATWANFTQEQYAQQQAAQQSAAQANSAAWDNLSALNRSESQGNVGDASFASASTYDSHGPPTPSPKSHSFGMASHTGKMQSTHSTTGSLLLDAHHASAPSPFESWVNHP